MTQSNDPADEFLSDDWLDRRRLLLGAAAAGGSGLLSAIASSPALANEKRGGILRYGFGDTNPGEKMDPATVQNGASIELMHIIYEPLVRRGKDWKFFPWLAESYELDKDKNTWTFRLRKGVKFHDGSPMTAKDVIYSLSRLVDEKVGASLRARLKGSFDGKSLEAVDDHTVKIYMLRRDTMLDQPLSRYNTGIIKAGTVPTADPETAIGTGAFRIKSFEPGQSWQVERFAGYWHGIPFLDGIQCVNIPDQTRESAIGRLRRRRSHRPGRIRSSSSSSPPIPGFGRAAADAMSWGISSTTRSSHSTMSGFAAPSSLRSIASSSSSTVYQGLGVTTPDVPLPPGDPMFPTTSAMAPRTSRAPRNCLRRPDFRTGIEFTLYTSPILPGNGRPGGDVRRDGQAGRHPRRRQPMAGGDLLGSGVAQVSGIRRL